MKLIIKRKKIEIDFYMSPYHMHQVSARYRPFPSQQCLVRPRSSALNNAMIGGLKSTV